MTELRPMQASDIEGLISWVPSVPLWHRYGLTAPKLTTQLEAALKAGDLLRVAYDQEAYGNQAACGFYWCQPKAAFGRSAYLKLIGVKEDYRDKGIGDALLETLEQELKGSSKDLFLLVSDFNEGAQRFYLRHGFEKLGRISSYVLPEVDEFIFRKILT
ncbi:MAG: GNAT family N-acetyltransferase [Trueperaceae bacterium]|nr:GNAT family N-acetyltransferase [Trueperaceae bacterium]